MADISNLITKIRNAIYGRDVRSAIADALSTLNSQADNFLPITGGSMTGLLGTQRVDVGVRGSLNSYPIVFKTHSGVPMNLSAVSIWGESILAGNVYEPVLKATRVNEGGYPTTNLARMQCAEPIDDDDVVTKKYFLQNMEEVVDTKIDDALDVLSDDIPLRVMFSEQSGNVYTCDYSYSMIVAYATLGKVVSATVVTANGTKWYCNLLRYSQQDGVLMFSNSSRFQTPGQGEYGVSVTYSEIGNISVSFDEPHG